MNPYPFNCVSDQNACTTSEACNDDWVLKELNDALADRSTAVTESALEDNLFANPSIPPSMVSGSETFSLFLEQDMEVRRLLRSDALLDSVLLGPHHTDVAGLTIDGHQDPAQYPTSVDLDNDVSMVDAQDTVDNVDNHHTSAWPSTGIPLKPSTVGPNGLLVPPPSHPRRSGGRNRNATLNCGPGTEGGTLSRVPDVLVETNLDEGHWPPPAVPEQGYFMAPSMPSSTVNRSFATDVNDDFQMTEAPVIPIINEPLPFTLPETQNRYNSDPNPYVPANAEDELLSLESPSVNDHDLISDISSNASGRSRKLKDRKKTHDVRKKGACLGCRIEKTPVGRPSSCTFQA